MKVWRITSTLLVAMLIGACAFDPDLSRYPSCDDDGGCPAAMTCWVERRRCLPTCGEQGCDAGGPDRGGADAGEWVDGGETDGGLHLASPSTLADGESSQPYQEQLYAFGGSGTYTWSLVSGHAVPVGLQLSSEGMISGTPTGTCPSGCTPFEIEVTDPGPPAQTRRKPFEIRVTSGSLGLHIRTRALADGQVGTGYTQVLRSGGGVLGTHQWSITSGSLPPGLQLQTNVITGTPTVRGEYPVTFRVTDSSLGSESRNFTVTIF